MLKYRNLPSVQAPSRPLHLFNPKEIEQMRIKNSTKNKELLPLIRHSINHHVENCISARDLYFGVGLAESQWKRWSSKNIIKNSFFEKEKDWVVFDIKSKTNGRPTEDYLVTIDFAKHLVMMAKTEFAHEYREYLINCEKRLVIIEKRKASSDWKLAVKDKKQSHIPMQDTKKAVMERDNQNWSQAEAIKENYFVNRALTGIWGALDDDELDSYDLKLLTAIRRHNNILLIKYGKKQDIRKPLLDKFVEDYRINSPRGNLIQEPRPTYKVQHRGINC
jgi:phage anti-repressor protein